MPYGADHRLEDMIDPDACEAACVEIADTALDTFEEIVRRNTPIDTSPFRDAGDRPRGALRASITREPVRRMTRPAGRGYGGRVFTEDDVGPYVEWDTAPHEITPRRPGGTLSWRDARTGERRFAKRVMHPGTVGAHMFAIGAAMTEHLLHQVAEPALDRWRRDVTEPRPWRRKIVA